MGHHQATVLKSAWHRSSLGRLVGLCLCVLLSACGARDTTVPEPSFPIGRTSAKPVAPPLSAYENLRFDHIGVADGLSQSSVTAILQDRQGFLWIGTFDGLNRYDGYQFTVYKYVAGNTESLGGNLVWRLLEDQGGRLWIATQGDGISQFDPDTGRFTNYRHDDDDPHSLSADFVQAIVEDREGTLWFGTLKGLDKLNQDTGEFTHYRNDVDPPEVTFGSNLVEAMAADDAGNLWLATYSGLLVFDPKQETFVRHEIDPGEPDANTIGSVFFDDAGVLWASTQGGLYWIDPGTLKTVRYSPDPSQPDEPELSLAHTIYQDQSGIIWLGTIDGLARWKPKDGRFILYRQDPEDPHSLNQSTAMALHTDATGIMWVGTQGGGLNRFNPWQNNFLHISGDPAKVADGPGSNHAWAFCEDEDGGLWIGTDVGLDRWDRDANRWKHWLADPNDPEDWLKGGVHKILGGRDGMFWVLSEGGLTRLDPATESFETHYSFDAFAEIDPKLSFVSDVVEDNAGDLWLAMAFNGLFQLDPKTKNLIHYRYVADDETAEPTMQNMIGSVIEDKERPGRLWLGTRAGLARFEDSTFTFFSHDPNDPNTPSTNDVNTIYQDEEGQLWLGTSAGLNRFDPATGDFRYYDETDGLPNNTVAAILPDDRGQLWLSTNRGLSRFDPQTETFRNYDSGDGLQGLEFTLQSAYRNNKGELFFGGDNGFNVFHPDSVLQSDYVPPVIITDLRILNGSVAVGPDSQLERPINRTDTLTLGPGDDMLAFELATPHFASPEDNRFAYFLEGFDRNWNYLGTRRFATYTNLPPGQYTFHAMGSNSDGVWNETSASIAITIQPPWWRAWWFRTLMVVSVLGLIGGGYQYRVSSIRAHSRRLADEVERRTRELNALYEITAVVSSSLDWEETISAALEKTLEIMSREAGGIHLLQKDATTLELASYRNLDEECVALLEHLPAAESVFETAIRSSKAQIYDETTLGPGATFATLCKYGFRWLVVTPLISRGAVLGTLFMTTRTEREFSGRDLDLLRSIGNQIGVAVENTNLFVAEHQRAEQFQLMNEVGRRFTSVLDINQVLAQVVRLIQQTFGYYHVAVGLIEGDEVVYRMGAGPLWDDPNFDFQPSRLKVGKEGLSGWVASSGRSLLVPDVRREKRYIWMQNSETLSELVVPILVKERVIGVLDLQSDHLNDFEETDLIAMQLLANQAGIAIENARLYRQARRLAVVEERNRLARDLHDSVTQLIYSLALLAEAGQRMIQAGNMDQITQNQARLGSIAQQALQEMRLLVYELRPLDLEKVGLVAALEQRLEVVERRTGMDARLTAAHDLAIPDEMEEALYRIAQEALNNALKHAGATTVSVTLQSAPEAISLEVQDNGKGFETALARAQAVHQGGLGLVSMRERAQEFGGDIRVTSAPGEGTTIYVELPLAEKEPGIGRQHEVVEGERIQT